MSYLLKASQASELLAEESSSGWGQGQGSSAQGWSSAQGLSEGRDQGEGARSRRARAWRGLQELHMSMCSTSRQPRELCSSRISGSCCEMRAVSSAEQHELLWYQLQFTAYMRWVYGVRCAACAHS